MHLIRFLAFYAAFFRFEIESSHVPGVMNVVADAISRNNITLLSSLHPQAARQPISQDVLELLVLNPPDWGSPSWTHSFKYSLITVSQKQPEQSTKLDGNITLTFAPH